MPCPKQTYNEKNDLFTVGIPHCFRVSPVSVRTFTMACCVQDELTYLTWTPYHTQEAVAVRALREVHGFLLAFPLSLNSMPFKKERGKCDYSQLLEGDVVRLFIRITGKGEGLGEKERGYVEWCHCISSKLGLMLCL